MATERVVLEGSERKPQDGTAVVGTPNVSDVIEVTLELRRRRPLELGDRATPISREEFASRSERTPPIFRASTHSPKRTT
jgi:hypothetical protein